MITFSRLWCKMFISFADYIFHPFLSQFLIVTRKFIIFDLNHYYKQLQFLILNTYKYVNLTYVHMNVFIYIYCILTQFYSIDSSISYFWVVDILDSQGTCLGIFDPLLWPILWCMTCRPVSCIVCIPLGSILSVRKLSIQNHLDFDSPD